MFHRLVGEHKQFGHYTHTACGIVLSEEQRRQAFKCFLHQKHTGTLPGLSRDQYCPTCKRMMFCRGAGL